MIVLETYLVSLILTFFFITFVCLFFPSELSLQHALLILLKFNIVLDLVIDNFQPSEFIPFKSFCHILWIINLQIIIGIWYLGLLPWECCKGISPLTSCLNTWKIAKHLLIWECSSCSCHASPSLVGGTYYTLFIWHCQVPIMERLRKTITYYRLEIIFQVLFRSFICTMYL